MGFNVETTVSSRKTGHLEIRSGDWLKNGGSSDLW